MPYIFGYSDPNGRESYTPDAGYALGLAFSSAFENNAGIQLWRGLKREFTEPVRPSYLFNDQLKIEQKYLNEKYGIEDFWTVPKGMSEQAAIQTHAIKQRQIAGQSAMNQAGLGVGWQLGVGLTAGMLDPLNIALSFTPLPWMAKFQAAEQSLSLGARIAARAGTGALEGALGAAIYEPISYAVNKAEGNDYAFQDSLVNVFFAAGAGALARPLFLGLEDRAHKIPKAADIMEAFEAGADANNAFDIASIPREQLPKDYAARVSKIPNTPDFDPLPKVVSQFDLDTRVSAFVKAVDQGIEGEDINITPVLEQARKKQIAQFEELATREIKFVPVKDGIAISANNSEINIQYAIVELDDLIVSHTIDGLENPEYPSAMQPRDRGQATSVLQVLDIANNLNPKRLGETFEAQTGAPIIGADGVVESGNGRTLSLSMVYAQDGEKAAQYRDYLASQKYPIDGFEKPVLVRVADKEREIAQRVEFAQYANGKTIGSYNATEQAIIDANKFTIEDLEFYQSGDLMNAANGPFVQKIIDKIANVNEFGELLDAKTKRLSQIGVDRIKAAMVQKAFGDKSLVRDLFTRTDNELKGIGNALAQIAPKWSKMRQMAQDGKIAVDADLTEHLVSAIDLVRIARQNGKNIAQWVANQDMFDELRPATKDFLHLMFGEKLNRQISATKIYDAMDFISEQAMLSDPSPNLLGEIQNVTAEELTKRGRAKINKGDELPTSAAANNGGGNGENGAKGNEPVGKNVSDKSGAKPEGVKLAGAQKLLKDYQDPELSELMAQSQEVDDMLDALLAQGALDDAQVQNLKNETNKIDNIADALSAAAYCLATKTGGELL